jgi:hypothetical protein
VTPKDKAMPHAKYGSIRRSSIGKYKVEKKRKNSWQTKLAIRIYWNDFEIGKSPVP